MESEIKNFIKVWIIAILSICYSYYIPTHIAKGIRRLIFLLPVVALFTLLPLYLSAANLCGPTAFFLVWLGNSKLVLFAFGRGPLSGQKTPIQFLTSSLLPIKFISEQTQNKSLPTLQKYALIAVKVVSLWIVVRIYDYRKILPTSFIYILYCCHIYLSVDVLVSMSSALVHAVLGIQMEPQFDEPYLATSLQDFWGHRWNLMVTGILRPTVYQPTLDYTSQLLGQRWSQALAVFAAFLFTGLMHELMYYYITRVAPTWEVTWFFVLQGVSMVAEVASKKAVAGRWRFPVAVSRLLTLGYVMFTSVWLFFPQLVRNGLDIKATKELHILANYFKGFGSSFFNP